MKRTVIIALAVLLLGLGLGLGGGPAASGAETRPAVVPVSSLRGPAALHDPFFIFGLRHNLFYPYGYYPYGFYPYGGWQSFGPYGYWQRFGPYGYRQRFGPYGYWPSPYGSRWYRYGVPYGPYYGGGWQWFSGRQPGLPSGPHTAPRR